MLEGPPLSGGFCSVCITEGPRPSRDLLIQLLPLEKHPSPHAPQPPHFFCSQGLPAGSRLAGIALRGAFASQRPCTRRRANPSLSPRTEDEDVDRTWGCYRVHNCPLPLLLPTLMRNPPQGSIHAAFVLNRKRPISGLKWERERSLWIGNGFKGTTTCL